MPLGLQHNAAVMSDRSIGIEQGHRAEVRLLLREAQQFLACKLYCARHRPKLTFPILNGTATQTELFWPATDWVYPNCLLHFLKPHKSMPLLWLSSEATYPINAPCADGLGVWTALRTEDITRDDLHRPSIVV